MKIIEIKKIIYLFLIGLVVTSCGEEGLPSDYEEYNVKELTDNDGNVSYQNLSTYPIIGDIASDAPSFDVEGQNKFLMGEIDAPAGSTYSASNFSIDNQTGVVTYNNSNGDLSPGTYLIDVKLGYMLGVVTYEDALQIDVKEVPVQVETDNASPFTGIFEQDVVATVSYKDTSGEDLITSVSYSLVNPPLGFSIDENTGEIQKSYPANSGENPVTVKVITNLGAVTAEDLVIVTVGEEPSIEYSQKDGTTPLNSVVLSPWTAYTTAVPSLDGMSASDYEIILPETLPSGSIVANADGSISVLADQNLPVGNYMIGVKVTNATGIEVIFEDVFELIVENRWESGKLFDDTFNDGTSGPLDPVNPIYPEYAGYTLGTTSAWQKVVITKDGFPDIEGLRVFNPGTDDHYLVRTIDISNVRALRISFGEVFGYNDNFVVTYKRALYAGESTSDLESGTFNAGNWTAVMPVGDSRWPGSNTWGSREPNMINNIDIDLDGISGDELKIAWFIGGSSSGQNGQYVVDSVSAEYATPFAAEEN